MRAKPVAIEKMLRVTEVSTVLSMDRWSVYDLIHSGELVAYDVGKKGRAVWRIKPSDLDNYLEVRRSSPPW